MKLNCGMFGGLSINTGFSCLCKSVARRSVATVKTASAHDVGLSGFSVDSCGLSFNLRCACGLGGGGAVGMNTICALKRALRKSTCGCRRANARDGNSVCMRSRANSAVPGPFGVPRAFNTNLACMCSGHLAVKISCALRG